ncbi:acyltransferase [Butyrivibrio sp. FC2001]|uniref:acyltransferase n=1 Tax=Butyrivibrio sp. FC2001 TaxID=1280671 RepID=UPI000422B346|nr:acyltransferase family protein [Butyrivibrio sp. FC2001]
MGKRVVNHNINLLKVISCIAVIILHTSAEHLFEVEYGSYSSIVMNAGHGLTRFAVTTFFLITGCLYLDEEYHIKDYKRYFAKIGHFVFLYFFYALAYSACAMVFSRQMEANVLRTAYKIVEHALTSPKYHLWYLPAYVGVLIGIPVLKRFVGSENQDKREIIRYAIILIFITMFINSLGAFNDLGMSKLTDMVSMFLSKPFAGWLGVCLIGFYIKKYSLKNYFFIYIAGIILFICSMVASYSFFGRIETAFYDNLTFQTTVFACVIFDYFVNRFQIKCMDRIVYFIDKLSELTLGIYLIHPLLLNVFGAVGFDSMMCNSLIAIPVVSLVAFGLSVIVVAIIKKIPFVGKLVV